MLIRWIALLSILLNVAFNGLYITLFPGLNIQEVSRSYHDLFTPAGYVFSIWGVIYLSFIIYGIVQLLPSNMKYRIYDRLAIPLIFSNILGSTWIIAFTNQYILLSMIILVITLALSIVMFFRSGKEVNLGVSSRWLWFPFSLFFGWISVAVIANAAVTFKSFGWDGGVYGAEMWTIAMISIAGLFAIIVDAKFNNYIYAVVIVWASVGIWDERQADHPTIGIVALISTTVMLLFVLGHALVRYLSTEAELQREPEAKNI